jgi:hypothetical protein
VRSVVDVVASLHGGHANRGYGEQMMQLEIGSEERSLLIDVLDSAYRNLKEEINKTETYAFKDELKAREAILLSLLDQLRALSHT